MLFVKLEIEKSSASKFFLGGCERRELGTDLFKLIALFDSDQLFELKEKISIFLCGQSVS